MGPPLSLPKKDENKDINWDVPDPKNMELD